MEGAGSLEEPLSLPLEVRKLAPRSQQIAMIVYRSRGCTLREIHAEIDDDVTIYGIRTLINRLVSRGIIKCRRTGRHSELIYLPNLLTQTIRRAALRRLIQDEFGSSPKSALAVAIRASRQDRD